MRRGLRADSKRPRCARRGMVSHTHLRRRKRRRHPIRRRLIARSFRTGASMARKRDALIALPSITGFDVLIARQHVAAEHSTLPRIELTQLRRRVLSPSEPAHLQRNADNGARCVQRDHGRHARRLQRWVNSRQPRATTHPQCETHIRHSQCFLSGFCLARCRAHVDRWHSLCIATACSQAGRAAKRRPSDAKRTRKRKQSESVSRCGILAR